MKQRPRPVPPEHRSPSFASLPARHRARGMALVEALVASAVLGIGLAGATRLTWHALQTATDTRQHTVAQALGVNAMECLQSGLSPCEMTQEVTVQGTRYSLQSQVRQRAD
ncbi:MAG: prepilin-type N-terminal cleavage/methylation domain-containing protein, partial [Limnohabitans sp.]|nr:prepilin-type N-terminal cleavage/methylation domain-containing protein [Limnohabitans sp.]